MLRINIGGVPEHFNFPWVLAQEDAAFEAQGIDLHWQDFYTGTGGMVEALKAEKLDVAIMLLGGSVYAINKGLDCRIVQTYVSTPLNWGIHVAADSNFKQVEDLNNRKAAISRIGSGSHLMSYLLAQDQAWDTAKMQFMVIDDIHGAEKALTKKEADYFLWEKAMTQPLVDKGVFRRIGVFKNNWPAFVIVVRTSFLKQHALTIEAMLQTINNYTIDFNLIPGIDTSIAAFYELPLTEVQDWLGNTQFSEMAVSPNLIQDVQKAYKNIGMLNTILPTENILTNV